MTVDCDMRTMRQQYHKLKGSLFKSDDDGIVDFLQLKDFPRYDYRHQISMSNKYFAFIAYKAIFL